MHAPDNWHLFLDENNVPSSPLIVEGANIFITADARTKLFEVGKVAIVKDSSANKVGHTSMYTMYIHAAWLYIHLFQLLCNRSIFYNPACMFCVYQLSLQCGVITSSCEVAASMLLSKNEFMDIKQELVEDVLHNLRNLARLGRLRYSRVGKVVVELFPMHVYVCMYACILLSVGVLILSLILPQRESCCSGSIRTTPVNCRSSVSASA